MRILFVDSSYAFNTIIPDPLQNKLTQLSIPTSICQWINSFLTDRQQEARLGKFLSSTRTISTGAPQSCVLSPLLFPCTRMTAHLNTPPSSSWSLQITPHWSASFRTVTSLLTDRRLRSWLSGAVLTTWSLTRSKKWRWSWTSGETPLLSPHLPSWTALWLQWIHSDYWALGLGDKTITICIAIDTWSISIKNVFDKTFDIFYSSSEENRGCEASLVALTKALALW